MKSKTIVLDRNWKPALSLLLVQWEQSYENRDKKLNI